MFSEVLVPWNTRVELQKSWSRSLEVKPEVQADTSVTHTTTATATTTDTVRYMLLLVWRIKTVEYVTLRDKVVNLNTFKKETKENIQSSHQSVIKKIVLSYVSWKNCSLENILLVNT